MVAVAVAVAVLEKKVVVLVVLVLVVMVEYLHKTVAERETINLTALDDALHHVAIFGKGIHQVLQ